MPYITKTIAKDLPNGDYIEVTAYERDDSGTLSPGFTITSDLWERRHSSGRARKRNGLEQDACGQLHDLVVQHFPHLAPVIHVHLADQNGVPMHAKANGWHFYSGGSSEYERRMIANGKDYGYSRMLKVSDHDRAARALHISPDELPTGLDKAGFEAFVDSLTERYAADAARAREVMAAMVDGEGVER